MLILVNVIVNLEVKSPYMLARGPMMGGPQCHMSHIRNDNVSCPLTLHAPLCLFVPNLKNTLCHVPYFPSHVTKDYVAYQLI